VERQKRFKLLVDFGDHLEWAYLPNPGGYVNSFTRELLCG